MKKSYITEAEKEKCRQVADAFAELYELKIYLSWMPEDMDL